MTPPPASARAQRRVRRDRQNFVARKNIVILVFGRARPLPNGKIATLRCSRPLGGTTVAKPAADFAPPRPGRTAPDRETPPRPPGSWTAGTAREWAGGAKKAWHRPGCP